MQCNKFIFTSNFFKILEVIKIYLNLIKYEIMFNLVKFVNTKLKPKLKTE